MLQALPLVSAWLPGLSDRCALSFGQLVIRRRKPVRPWSLQIVERPAQDSRKVSLLEKDEWFGSASSFQELRRRKLFSLQEGR